MQYLKQVCVLLGFTLLGQALQQLLPLPIPAAIYGLVLLFVALCTGLVKPKHIDTTANFLISIMPVLFVAPAVNILEHWDLIAPDLGAILTIAISTTVIVFAITGWVTQWLRKKGGDSRD